MGEDIRDKRRYTVCACASRSFIPLATIASVVASLRGEGHEVRVVADLCRLVERADESLADIASTTLVGCYPRALEALFQSRGLAVGPVVGLRGMTEAEAARWSAGEAARAQAMAELRAFVPEVGHDAWFPVIDRSRCVDCGQCHDFCLFGVYAREAGQVRVVAPDRCKNNCPACARVCPERAIIFPKYSKSPINGGLEDEENLEGLDAKSLYAEALRTRLRQRRASVSLLGGQPEKEGGARDE